VVVGGDDITDSLVGVLDWSYDRPRNSWICGTSSEGNKTLITESIADFDCSISVALSEDNDPWLMNNQSVEYCLSEPVPDVCRLQFAIPIMVVVLACNFIKLLCMILTLWRCKEPTLVTLGDALSSFLEKVSPVNSLIALFSSSVLRLSLTSLCLQPDHNTRGMCTITKRQIEAGDWPYLSRPKRWTDRRPFRFEAIGLRRWIFSNATYVTV
jgi:hypothetical protein